MTSTRNTIFNRVRERMYSPAPGRPRRTSFGGSSSLGAAAAHSGPSRAMSDDDSSDDDDEDNDNGGGRVGFGGASTESPDAATTHMDVREQEGPRVLMPTKPTMVTSEASGGQESQSCPKFISGRAGEPAAGTAGTDGAVLQIGHANAVWLDLLRNRPLLLLSAPSNPHLQASWHAAGDTATASSSAAAKVEVRSDPALDAADTLASHATPVVVVIVVVTIASRDRDRQGPAPAALLDSLHRARLRLLFDRLTDLSLRVAAEGLAAAERPVLLAVDRKFAPGLLDLVAAEANNRQGA
ncbi:hypothetical protein HK405_015082 [Cladochytrium tenue]|nr:hypothetical protein HK405_015082 [Cladochytrium tenue]